MDKFVTFANTLDGRDKLTKALQYGSRYIAAVSVGNKEVEQRFKNLMGKNLFDFSLQQRRKKNFSTWKKHQ